MHSICGARGAIVAATIGAILAIALPSASATTSHLTLAFEGEAYGSTLTVGSTVKSGPTFKASIGACTSGPGSSSTKTGLSSKIPNVLKTGTVTNSVVASQGSTSGATTATSNIQSVNAVSGLITADAVKAVSKTIYTQGSGFSFANNSAFVNLRVNGNPVAVTAANTTVTLSGIGYVVFNEQKRTVKTNSATQIVNMIHLVVTKSNPLGLEVGANLIVAHAVATVTGPHGAGGPVDGFSYGTMMQVGSTLKSSPSARAAIPCLGGSNDNEILAVNVPNVLSTAQVYDTAQATLTSTYSKGETTSTVHTLNLLNGLVKADVIKADAHGTFDGSTHTFSQSGSQFTSLSVNGQPISVVPANTQISVPNVGTLYLDRVIHGTRSIEVRMIELVVTVANNPLGLPLGTDVRVAVANVSFHY
jgi:hypothetical protein